MTRNEIITNIEKIAIELRSMDCDQYGVPADREHALLLNTELEALEAKLFAMPIDMNLVIA